jgi:hypothetical protein
MPRREPPKGRRAPFRTPRRTMLVAVGAERTEADYLRGLRDEHRLTTVALKIVAKAESPDRLVAYVKDTFVAEDFDDIWCVTDVDHYEREGGKVTAAVRAARGSGISLAVSNPCFEVWLLLHFEDLRAHCRDYAEVERRLRKHLPAYDKARLRFGDYADGIAQAVEWARALDPSGADHQRNPSSGMWRLVESLERK